MLYERTEEGLRRFQGELPEAVAGVLERADEDSIVAAVGDGRFTEEYLYCLQVNGREVIGISAAGAFEMARLLGSVEVLPEVRISHDDSGYQVVVRVRDNQREVTLLGAARQPMRRPVSPSGEEGPNPSKATEKPDPNAWVVAVNKAQRNGILRLVSAETKRRIIEGFLARGQRRDLGRAEGEQHQNVPTATGKIPGESMTAEAVSVSRSMSSADFAAGCRQKGYRTFAEVCSILGFPDKRSLVQYGLARALEKLPDRNMSSQVSAEEDLLDEVDQGF